MTQNIDWPKVLTNKLHGGLSKSYRDLDWARKHKAKVESSGYRATILIGGPVDRSIGDYYFVAVYKKR